MDSIVVKIIMILLALGGIIWGIWYERTIQYNSCSRLLDNIRPCHRYWPIPSNQVANSGGALDNKEYGE